MGKKRRGLGVVVVAGVVAVVGIVVVAVVGAQVQPLQNAFIILVG